MKISYHKNGRVTAENAGDESVAAHLKRQAIAFPDEILVWCHADFQDNLNVAAIEALFATKKMMFSYDPSAGFLPDAIGYADESPFINFNKDARFPTWRMSSCVGAIPASVLNAIGSKIPTDGDFDYFLNSLAKLAMPLGLFCYSEPDLLLSPPQTVASAKADTAILFRFVKQHYKTVWVFLLLLDLLVYERRFPFLAALQSLFYARRHLDKSVLDGIAVPTRTEIATDYDVLIPTIGREKYLHDFLKDLSAQEFLPEKVIIIEQNPEPGSCSALPYLHTETWPFKIVHHFIHQAGACNARNIALKEATSDWIFFADDDIRIGTDFMEALFAAIASNTGEVFNICCVGQGQKSSLKTVHQTSIFGSGCSIASRKSVGNTDFDKAYEFGFGEDIDFAMQLMQKGFDTTYLPNPIILHLKAPVGGFRTKPKLAWDGAAVLPKPSPTVMLYKLSYQSVEQLRGYKTTLFFKFYNRQSVKNPLRYWKIFNKSWDSSIFWAKTLDEQKTGK